MLRPRGKVRQKASISILVSILSLLLCSLFVGMMLFHDEPQPPPPPAPKACEDGQIRPCEAGACQGVSRCVGSRWSGCLWEQVCMPGVRHPCVHAGCIYAYKVCDECGSGYGPCIMDDCLEGLCPGEEA